MPDLFNFVEVQGTQDPYDPDRFAHPPSGRSICSWMTRRRPVAIPFGGVASPDDAAPTSGQIFPRGRPQG